MSVPEKDFIAKGKRFISLQDGSGLGFIVGGKAGDAVIVDVYFEGKPTGDSFPITPQGAIKLAHALATVAVFGEPLPEEVKDEQPK